MANKKFSLNTSKVIWIILAIVIIITAYFLLRPSPIDDLATEEPIVVTSDELIELFSNDPRAAQDQYMGEYIEMTAALYSLDYRGNIVTIGPVDGEYSYYDDLIGRITDEQFDYLTDLYEEGIEVEIKGVVASYNALLGCQILIDEIAVKYY